MTAKAAKSAKILTTLSRALRANTAEQRKAEVQRQADRFARLAAGKSVTYTLTQRYV